MAIITINGPGGERSVQVNDPDLLAELIAKGGDLVVNVEGDAQDDAAPDERTVAQLRDELVKRGVDIPKGSRKADLVDLLDAQDDAAPAED